VQTHVGADVRGHIAKGLIENPRYDVSKAHFETNLHIICAGVSLSMTAMSPPHLGQVQDDTLGALSVEPMTGAILSR
jgi:hypothetical protein